MKRWLRAEEGAVPRYRRGQQAGKLVAFKAWLEKALEADAGRARRDRHMAKALFDEIKAQGYAGGYTMLTTFIRRWRERARKRIDAGVWRALQVAHLKLCASRAFVLVAYPGQGHEMLFDAHSVASRR